MVSPLLLLKMPMFRVAFFQLENEFWARNVVRYHWSHLFQSWNAYRRNWKKFSLTNALIFLFNLCLMPIASSLIVLLCAPFKRTNNPAFTSALLPSSHAIFSPLRPKDCITNTKHHVKNWRLACFNHPSCTRHWTSIWTFCPFAASPVTPRTAYKS